MLIHTQRVVIWINNNACRIILANGFSHTQNDVEQPVGNQGIKEGKIADLEHVSGPLDDDDLEEFSDF